MLPWLLIVTVVGVGVWMVVDYLGRSENEPRALSEETPSPKESTSVSITPTPEETTPSPKEKEPRQPKKKLITEGITIQVLNGTKDPEAGEAMAQRLRDLGFQVVAVEFSSADYKQTTVFWSFPAAERAASRLAARFGWDVDEKPGNLAATVSMHVVVGKDEAGSAPR
jgi:hypothetical protein